MLTEKQKRAVDSAPRIRTGTGMAHGTPSGFGSSKLDFLRARGELTLYEQAWRQVRRAPRVHFRRRICRRQVGWEGLKPWTRRDRFPELLESPEAALAVSYSVYVIDGEVVVSSNSGHSAEYSSARELSGWQDPREELFAGRARTVVRKMQERLEEREELAPLHLRIRLDKERADVAYMLMRLEELERRTGGLALAEAERLRGRLLDSRRELERYRGELHAQYGGASDVR